MVEAPVAFAQFNIALFAKWRAYSLLQAPTSALVQNHHTLASKAKVAHLT